MIISETFKNILSEDTTPPETAKTYQAIEAWARRTDPRVVMELNAGLKELIRELKPAKAVLK